MFALFNKLIHTPKSPLVRGDFCGKNPLKKFTKIHKFIILSVLIAAMALIWRAPIAFGFGRSKSDDDQLNKVYKRGKTTLKLRIAPDKSGLATQKFNHPYFFTKDQLVDVLSTVYYVDKNITKKIMKRKITSPGKPVFQDDEIAKLTPLILEAFSKSTPQQDLLINSYSDRFLLQGLYTTFSLFMTGDKLNIAFAHIRDRKNVSLSSVVKTRKLERNKEPTNVKKSHYWEIVAKSGQQLKKDHKNWLIIDFKNAMFIKTVQQQKQDAAIKYDKKLKPMFNPLEDRIKKLEQMLAEKDKKDQGTQRYQEPYNESYREPYREQAPVKEFPSLYDPPAERKRPTEREKRYAEERDKRYAGQRRSEPSINRKSATNDISALSNKFYALRDLMNDGLITVNDYNQKKDELLTEFHMYDIKTSLKELKKLEQDGLISYKDFQYTKGELLDSL